MLIELRQCTGVSGWLAMVGLSTITGCPGQWVPLTPDRAYWGYEHDAESLPSVPGIRAALEDLGITERYATCDDGNAWAYRLTRSPWWAHRGKGGVTKTLTDVAAALAEIPCSTDTLAELTDLLPYRTALIAGWMIDDAWRPENAEDRGHYRPVVRAALAAVGAITVAVWEQTMPDADPLARWLSSDQIVGRLWDGQLSGRGPEDWVIRWARRWRRDGSEKYLAPLGPGEFVRLPPARWVDLVDLRWDRAAQIRTRRVVAEDLVDTAGMAQLLRVSPIAVRGALAQPDRNPGLARRLPEPVTRLNGGHVWIRPNLSEPETPTGD